MRNALELERVNVFYENVQALSNIYLKVKENDFLGIIGPNGGGKSTLLKTILGLLKPSSGKIRVFDQPINKEKGVIGYVPQFTKFNKNFPINVKDVVLMGLMKNYYKMFTRVKASEEKRAEAIMKKLDIFQLRDRQIGQLSGGQLQRVLIARALAIRPKILLLDEPTANLDSNAKSKIYNLLKYLNKNMTIIMVTHDMSIISSYVKSIACLNTELFYHGEPKLTKHILRKVYGWPIDMVEHGMPHIALHGEEKNV
ncbi:metal ABC transporter ATP-binding protein [Crassaminicella thermophila]|uniref:Metal ABC transporter ATP-binding protein n=1 Tax=Crassaminicella thermophila TaxID=2599308 RepID=A0A5C0SBD6_CRATE|nr:metal ABC transporter ATP-binding protein [Crassaminicella thermophila]QEK11227.1 metal ABC transporter ATP-binding protein [Crassaminicella thermophila]